MDVLQVDSNWSKYPPHPDTKLIKIFVSFCVAFFVGTIVALSNLCHLTCLLTFFHACNKATKFRHEQKRKCDQDFKEGGQRDANQVLSNGLLPTLFSAMYLLECGYGERPIDYLNNYNSTWYSIAVLGMSNTNITK